MDQLNRVSLGQGGAMELRKKLANCSDTISASKRAGGQENVTANRSAISNSAIISFSWSNPPVGIKITISSRSYRILRCF